MGGAGDLVGKDPLQAAKWHRRAAERGYAPAQFSLGLAYAHGTGLAKDEAAAVEWYRKAAKQGHAKARYNLGVAYATGRGTYIAVA